MPTLTEQTTTQLMQEARDLGLKGTEILAYLKICKDDGTFDQLLLDKQRQLELDEIRQKREGQVVTERHGLKVK